MCFDHTGDCCTGFQSLGMYLIAFQNTVGQIAHPIAFTWPAQTFAVVGMAQLSTVSSIPQLIAYSSIGQWSALALITYVIACEWIVVHFCGTGCSTGLQTHLHCLHR